MVSANHHNDSLRHHLRQFIDKMIEYLYCLCRRHCFIINISCNQNGIRFFFSGPLYNLMQDIFL